MQPLLAIAWLTLKSAVRFRLFQVLAVLLLGAVIGLPLVIKDDGTARGFIQIMLTYNLGLITVLLGLATLWLSCGTLARDIAECQAQMLDVKPVARWQVWLGKWLGIMALNALLLALSGSALFFLLIWRANGLPTQPVDQRAILFNEVLVARGSAREPPPDLERDVERVLEKKPREMSLEGVNLELLRRQLRADIKAQHEVVPPNFLRRWTVDLGPVKHSLRGQTLYLRVKFYAAQKSATGTYDTVWEAGPPDRPRSQLTLRLAAETFHELQVPTALLDEQGRLNVECSNRSQTALVFPLEDGLEVLYREGGFGLNFVRGLLIVFCWLGLLASLGLASASGLSFPVAAFFSLSVLLIVLSSGTLAGVIQQGSIMDVNHETGERGSSWVDWVVLPAFKALLKVINLVQGFSPIDALSTGRSITWGQLGLAFTQILVLMSGLIGAIGITIFNRRELATAQGT